MNRRTISILLVAIAVTGSMVISMPSATAYPQKALLRSPVDGSITSDPYEPHHRVYSSMLYYGQPGDFAYDIGAPAGRPVYARFASGGNVSLAVVQHGNACANPANGAGHALAVRVAVDGVEVARVVYSHLDNLHPLGPIANGAQIGTVHGGSSQTSCWTGPHVHVEPSNVQRYACFNTGVRIPNGVSGSTTLGVVGGEFASGVNQGCPGHAYDLPAPTTTTSSTTTSTSTTTTSTTTTTTSTTVPANGDREVERISGTDRYATAAAISLRTYPATAPAVFLANGRRYADSLAASTIRVGPVLLVPDCGVPVPAVVRDAISRLNPAEVTGLGGVSAVCDSTLADAAGGRPIYRLGASDRYATAVEISKYQFSAGAPTVYLARSDGFADALAGGVLTDGPILLVPSCGGVPGVVHAEIDRLEPNAVIALGGARAICDGTLREASGSRSSGRIAGLDRFETAAAISRHAFPTSAPVAYLASSEMPADALAGGSVVDGPLLLAPACGELPDPIRDELARLGTSTVVLLGGTQALCDHVGVQAAQR